MMVPPRSRRRLVLAALCALVALPACASLLGLERGELGAESGAGGGGGGMGGGGDAGGGGSSSTGDMCGDPPSEVLTGALRELAKSTQSTYAQATAVAFGTSGEIFVSGTYHDGPITLGEHAPWPYVDANNDHEPDVFLASYDPVRNAYRWSQGLSGPGHQQILSIATDPTNGDVLVAGRFSGSFSLDGGVTSMGDADAFVARFSKDGALLWKNVYANAQDQFGVKVAVDANGHAALAIQGFGELTFGEETKGDPQGSTGSFVVKLNPDGAAAWSRYWNYTYFNDADVSLAFDAEGNLVIAGGSGGESTQSSDPFRGGIDLYAMKLDPDGIYLWSRMFGGQGPSATNGDQFARAVATDCEGDVYIAGAFQVDLQLGAMPLLEASADDAESDYDVFVAKLDGDTGEPVWAHGYPDAGFQLANALGVDASLHVVVSGILIDTAASKGINFGGGKLVGPGPDGTDYLEDFFVAKLTGDEGAHTWSHRHGDSFIQQGVATTNPAGEVAVAGDFFFSIELDGSPDGLLEDTARDMFVALFDP